MPKQKPTKSKKLKKQAKPEKRAKPSKAKPAKLAKQLKRVEKKHAKQVNRTEKQQAKKAKKAGVPLNDSSKRGNKSKADRARPWLRQITQLPMAAPNMRVGLLGGSFNPPWEAA